jgi:uncharacterized protein YndB with AHSA1/START domain
VTGGAGPAGDQVKVSVLVRVEPRTAFRIFTEEIDQWWRRGARYRVAGGGRGVIHLEGRLGGRLFESFGASSATPAVETGRVTAWEPPGRLVLEWRAANFAPGEKTEVEVTFAASEGGTRVTVVHRGWGRIREDHPVRHALPVAEFIRSMGLWWGDLLSSLRVHAEGQADR